MSTRLAALTEKEKQALRLLLAGHDAKSMARQLGLSVHTINERLRDARRKLGVSSSREAARQLRADEDEAPQSLGDRQLGAAPTQRAVQPAGRSSPGSDHRHRRRWLTGGIVMSISLALLALLAVSGETPGQPAGPRPEPAAATSEAAAIAAARQWLALSDAGDVAGAWQASGQAFKALNTPAAWAAAFGRVRTPLGEMIERKLVTVDFAPAPPQGYYVVKFRTRYANRPDLIEVLSLAWEAGGWKMVGITVE